MPGKLAPNLRKGHLAEDLGIFFLRSFCAVADVRQEDDFGIDALATLVRKEKKLLIAEQTFAVQIKAASVKEVLYEGSEVNWLLRQFIPFFFLRVDLNLSSFELYTINPVFGLFVQEEIHKIKLLFDTPKNEGSRIKLSGSFSEISIGPAILTSDIR